MGHRGWLGKAKLAAILHEPARIAIEHYTVDPDGTLGEPFHSFGIPTLHRHYNQTNQSPSATPSLVNEGTDTPDAR